MKETTIYLETLLTDKVLEGLEEMETYTIFHINKTKEVWFGKELMGDQDFICEYFTNILLPITVTSDMVEKEAERRYIRIVNSLEYFDKCDGFEAGANWILNLNKEGVKNKACPECNMINYESCNWCNGNGFVEVKI